MRRRVMNTSAPARIALWAVFLVVGVIVAAVALLMLLGRSVNKKRCTQPVTAVVVDYETRVSRTKKRGQITTYAPILEYEFRGQTYRYPSSVSTSQPRFPIGQRVELMIDPDNPATAYDSGNAGNVACFIALGASAIFLFLGIFGVSLNAKRIKQNKTGELPPSHSNWN